MLEGSAKDIPASVSRLCLTTMDWHCLASDRLRNAPRDVFAGDTMTTFFTLNFNKVATKWFPSAHVHFCEPWWNSAVFPYESLLIGHLTW